MSAYTFLDAAIEVGKIRTSVLESFEGWVDIGMGDFKSNSLKEELKNLIKKDFKNRLDNLIQASIRQDNERERYQKDLEAQKILEKQQEKEEDLPF